MKLTRNQWLVAASGLLCVIGFAAGYCAHGAVAGTLAAVDQITCDPAPFVEVPRCPGSTSLLPAQACPGGRFRLLAFFRCRREGMARDFVTVEEGPWESLEYRQAK